MTDQLPDKGSLQTRSSLLFRLRDWKDDVSWDEFYRLYHKLIYGVARRAGLPHVEAEEVAQDVFKRVSETIDQFESDPARGSFRGWLMNLTRWRVMDRFRSRARDERNLPVQDLHASPGAPSNPLEQLPDPASLSDEATEAEWRESLLAAALERLARRVPPKHFQVFDLYSRQQWPVLRVARELGVNPATVYVISHRLTRDLRKEVEKLQRSLG